MTTSFKLQRYNFKNRGFTLIEMLVVLVVISITTTILVEGLGTTWRNFDKLNSQQLVVNKGILPKKWFIDSFKGAQLFHPMKPNTVGTSTTFSFITVSPPGATSTTLSHVTWSIENALNNQQLFYSINHGEKVSVVNLDGNFTFNYLDSSGWSNSYSPERAELPIAVTISSETAQWVIVTPGRSTKASIPTSIALDGIHEL